MVSLSSTTSQQIHTFVFGTLRFAVARRVWKSLSSSFWAEHIQIFLVPSVHAISLCCTRTTSGMPSLSGHLWLGPPPPLSALCDALPGSGLSLLCPFPGSPVCPSVLCPCSCLLPSSSHLLPNPPSACLRLSSSPGPMLCPSAPLIRAPLLPSLFASRASKYLRYIKPPPMSPEAQTRNPVRGHR